MGLGKTLQCIAVLWYVPIILLLLIAYPVVIVQDNVQAGSLWWEAIGKKGTNSHSRKFGQGLVIVD